MPSKVSEKYQSISHGFKISVVALLFMLTAVRLLSIVYFPASEIVPDKFFLFAILFILFYLWVQEQRDFQRLIKMNKQLFLTQEQLKESEIDTIAALIKTEEEKDFYTRGHSERVTKVALAIAQELNLSEEIKGIINRAAILHDIGKIAISDAILNKKETLTDQEWALIKAHPENAAQILGPLKFLTSEREIILQHHERYDGRGYPRGLKSEEIRLEAQIIAVADAFDAMNSKRAYREMLDRAKIITELQNARGNQHSPRIIDTFLAMLRGNPQLWEK